MKEVFLSVFVVMEEGDDYGKWIQSYWKGELSRGDPLQPILNPDMRGEVTAWGDLPHWTVTDALTTSDQKSFVRAVHDFTKELPQPTLKPKNLKIYGKTALVVECESDELGEMRVNLTQQTHDLITRSPLADEEWQRARWWILRGCNNIEKNLDRLFEAKNYYEESSSPPLPSSRHFRLGFLMRLYKTYYSSEKKDKQKSKAKLDEFLKFGEPPWYRIQMPSFHTTIASGLDGTQNINCNTIWQKVQKKLPKYKPKYLAIMGEDQNTMFDLYFYDWLTETYVKETRPGFKIIAKANFMPS